MEVTLIASRAQDVVDILLETDGTPNKGWQTDPAIPKVIVEDRDNKPVAFFHNPPTDGVIIVKKGYDYARVLLTPDLENRVRSFDIVIVAETDAKLELMINQFREVFDRYTDSPFATDTNSNTYTSALVDGGETVDILNSWVFDARVQLTEICQSVVIA